jgi:3-hydroxyacyl-CoA dehydrogenase / enoyl-CoA hydratase / 3-hydroxybutyryl-CoA epimerase / enoyl-CoA isomerase
MKYRIFRGNGRSENATAAVQSDSQVFTLTRARSGVYTLLLNTDGEVNTIQPVVLRDLERIVEMLVADRTCRGLVITTPFNKPGIAGADINEIYRLQSEADVNAFTSVTDEMKRILSRLSTAPFPTVAAINGSWRGGGFEMALFCHHIFGISGDEQHSSVQLPEILVGLLPGAKGNIHVAQRMARLTDAVEFVVGAKNLKAVEAHDMGLIDGLCPDYEQMMASAERYCLLSATSRKILKSSLRQQVKWRRALRTARELKGLFGPQRGKVAMDVLAPSVLEHFGATLMGLGLFYEVLATIIGGPNVHGWLVTMLVGPNFFVTALLAIAIAIGASFDQSMRQWLAQMVVLQVKGKTNLSGPVSAASLIMQVRDLPEDVLSGMESQLFAQEARSPYGRGLVSLFVKKSGARDAFSDVAAPAVKSLAVVGAGGPMGAGIAALAAAAESIERLVLIDIEPDLLVKALARIEKHIDKSKLPAHKKSEALAKIVTALDYAALADCDVIIEAVPEIEGLKRKIYGQIVAVMQARSEQKPWFLLTNTSALDLDLLASDLGEQALRFAGLHFFNPPEQMNVVEIGRGTATTDETMAVGVQLVVAMNKAPLPVFNSRAFLLNRQLGPYLVMLAHLLAEGVPPEEIDRAIKHSGAPMGPALLLDKVGADIVASVAKTLLASLGSRMALPADDRNVLAILLKLGHLGEKTGRGIYVWENGKPARDKKGKLIVNPALVELFPGLGTNKSYSREAIQILLLGAIANEAVRVIEEGVVAPEYRNHGDAAFVLGTGLTGVWGGPIGYLNAQGVRVFARLSRIIAKAGPESWRQNFQPCPLLVEHERTGKDIDLEVTADSVKQAA